MSKKYLYEIAGFLVEIVWKLPDGQRFDLPGFRPFLRNVEDLISDHSDILLRFEIESVDDPYRQRQVINFEKDIFKFDIENGKCILRKKEDIIQFQIFDQDENLSLQMIMKTGDPCVRCGCLLQKRFGPDVLSPDLDFLRFAIWMAFAFEGIPRFAAPIHSSVIVSNQKAVLFLGESGTGKSTHTRLWLDHIPGSQLLNDDSPVIRLLNVDSAVANLQQTEKHSVFYVYGTPWSGKGRVYKSESYPVAGIVRLQQAPYNRAQRLNTVDGFTALYPSFPPAYLRDENLHVSICNMISEILKNIPVFRLECLPKPSAAYLINNEIFVSEKDNNETQV